MLGAGLRLNTFREEKKTQETATPDTILWLKEGFGEKVDFGDWNRSHEIGYLEGEFRSVLLLRNNNKNSFGLLPWSERAKYFETPQEIHLKSFRSLLEHSSKFSDRTI